MQNWLKGILGMSIGLSIIGAVIAIGYYISIVGAVVAFVCAVFIGGAFLSLIYAVEKNDFKKGAFVPLLVVAAIITGIVAQPPIPETFGLCILAGIFGAIMVQEGE